MKNRDKMNFKPFKEFSKFKRILVSGPQRSGSEICAKMIANDGGFELIRESMYSFHNEDKFDDLLKQENIVVHCPAMAHIVHKYGDDETLIIFMKRNIKDILKSQEVINWTKTQKRWEMKKYGFKRGIISKIKYDYWEKYQKNKIKHFLEIQYESLKVHPFWKNPEDRPKKRKKFGEGL